MLPRLLDPESEHDYVCADSAYSGECFEDLLSLGGFESLIHKKGARNKPLSEASEELNRIKSAIRACVEHVFGRMAMSMGREGKQNDWAGENQGMVGAQKPHVQLPPISAADFQPG